MNVKEAVQLAKAYFADIFAEEKMNHVSLEEVKFDDHSNTWKITIGFFPPWEQSAENPVKSMFGGTQAYGKRSYKVIQIDDEDGEVISTTIRFLNSEN